MHIGSFFPSQNIFDKTQNPHSWSPAQNFIPQTDSALKNPYQHPCPVTPWHDGPWYESHGMQGRIPAWGIEYPFLVNAHVSSFIIYGLFGLLSCIPIAGPFTTWENSPLFLTFQFYSTLCIPAFYFLLASIDVYYFQYLPARIQHIHRINLMIFGVFLQINSWAAYNIDGPVQQMFVPHLYRYSFYLNFLFFIIGATLFIYHFYCMAHLIHSSVRVKVDLIKWIVMDQLSPYLNPRQNKDDSSLAVLDVGCGRGVFMAYAGIVMGHRYSHNSRYEKPTLVGIDTFNPNFVIASDPTATWVNLAGAGTPLGDIDTTIWFADARAIPYSENLFRVIFCSLTLECFSNSDKIKVVEEMVRVLAPDGVLVILTINSKVEQMVRSFKTLYIEKLSISQKLFFKKSYWLIIKKNKSIQ